MALFRAQIPMRVPIVRRAAGLGGLPPRRDEKKGRGPFAQPPLWNSCIIIYLCAAVYSAVDMR